jgi:hypothetical protein
MKSLNTRRIGLCLGVGLVLSSAVLAQELATTATPAYLRPGESLLGLVRWRVSGKDGHLLSVISQTDAAVSKGQLPSRHLRIYREAEGKLTELYKFETPDALLNIYPLGDYNARLVVTWVGGSAYHLRVIADVDGDVKQVLDEGTKLPPEVLYDEKGEESVLITEPTIQDGHWTAAKGTTTVFKWNGSAYERIGVVSWANRLQCVSKESCAALK